MNGRAAFEYLLLTVQATADLASGNRWELWRCGWLGQGGRKWRMNYGWTDEVRGRGGGRGGGGLGGGLAKTCAPLTGKLLVGGVA